jgi:hypothetical protein
MIEFMQTLRQSEDGWEIFGDDDSTCSEDSNVDARVETAEDLYQYASLEDPSTNIRTTLVLTPAAWDESLTGMLHEVGFSESLKT